MDSLWTLKGLHGWLWFQAYWLVVISYTAWLEKNLVHSHMSVFDHKTTIIIITLSYNWLLGPTLRSFTTEWARWNLKGKSFTYRGVYHWRGITFPLYSEQDKAQQNSEEETMTEKLYCQAANRRFATYCYMLYIGSSLYMAILRCPGVFYIPIPVPVNLLFGCRRWLWRQIEQVLAQEKINTSLL